MDIVKSKALPLIAGLGLYLFATGVSYAIFNSLGVGLSGGAVTPIPRAEGRLQIDPGEPKTEECPLNGKKFTKTEKKSWEQRRPLAVMIENHTEARPQSGLSRADVVYEAVAEGAITRFLTLFYCQVQAEETQLGPIRSARTYYLDWASEYVFPLYVHVGGAHASDGVTDVRARAKEQIIQYGWSAANDLDQAGIGFPTFWRDYERLGRTVATEHTMYSTSEKLWAFAKDKRDFTNEDPDGEDWLDDFTPWKFADESDTGDRGSVAEISFDFWSDYEDYEVVWNYDKEANVYRRTNGGEPQRDRNDESLIEAKVVVVQFTQEEGPVDDLKHMIYGTTKGGKLLIFQNGAVVEGTWSKKSRTDRTLFVDAKKKEVEFVRGQIWVEIVPAGQDVEY
ncbi:MAG: DUF3048 domain-containing protein [Candidatus Chisholmbacteria bacterium]|nr:DUF3048 domain-containing protein [Candidatus Chisholmbacteria bacterium]